MLSPGATPAPSCGPEFWLNAQGLRIGLVAAATYHSCSRQTGFFAQGSTCTNSIRGGKRTDERRCVRAPSDRLVTWRRGVLAEGHRPRLKIRVAQEAAYEDGGSADAGPVVVPQRRNQPRTVGGEHQVGQGAVRPRVVPAPSGGLLRTRLYQDVMAAGIQRH